MPAQARHTRSLAFLFLAAMLLAAAPARAEDGKEAAANEAAAGDKAFAAGDHSGALAHYDAAYALYPTANLMFNRGLVLVELKRPVDAVLAFEAFLDGAKDAPAKARQYADEQIAKLERKVARVTVRAKRTGSQLEVAGAQVTLNGKLVGELPSARPFVVAPGDYRLEVTAEGYRPYTVDNITLVAGAPQVIVAQLAQLDLAVRSDPGGENGGLGGPTEHKSVLRKWWFWGIVGTVVVGATVATILILGADGGGPDSDLGTVEPRF